MAGRLENKSIVIMGGTTGLGLSAALAMTKEGARVVVVGRQPDRAAAAEKALAGRGLGLAGDASLPATSTKAISQALDRHGGFHGLYHVAGGSGRKFGDGPLDRITDEGWQTTLRLNLTPVFCSNRAAIQQFLEQGTGGVILNMTSVLGYSPSPKYFDTHAYATAKAAIIGLTTAAAAHYAPYNIRVNAIAPALVATPMSERAQTDSAILDFIATKQPLDGGRIGQPQDLDEAAVFLMSDAARFVTGQVLAVDGGWCVSEGQWNPPSASDVSDAQL